MPEPSENEILGVTHEFLVRYAEDVSAGTSLSLEGYQALHPGFEKVIAREYQAVIAGRSADRAEQEVDLPVAMQRLGPFRILEELGHGGQGLVYLAEDTRLHRRVALKVLSLHAPLSPSTRSRFRREVEAASKLDHPGICTVYQAGEIEAAPYFAMRYIEGETLAARLARERTQGVESSSSSGRSSGRHRVAAILTFFEKLADALHFAHEHGFVHRDVKPGNIMIEPSGQPVLLDFGLAHAMEGSGPSLTISGDLLGTPAYMAPEQVAGRGGGVDRRTDVYALAVTLYEALTLRRPFEAESRESLYRQILGDDPVSPRAYSHHVSRELEVVLQRALEKAPARRYETAAELGEELRRIRTHEPIRTRAPGPVLRVRRWTQRNPVAATFLVLLSLGLVVALGLLREIRLKESETDAALDLARAEALVGTAAKAVEDDPPLALRFALEALEIAPDLPAAVSEVHRAVSQLRQVHREFGHEGPIVSLAVTADGTQLLTAGADRVARLWDLEEESPPIAFGHDGPVYFAAFSPDEALVVTASADGLAKLWKADGELLEDFVHPDWVWTAVFSPTEQTILTGCEDGFTRLWDFAGNKIHERAASRYPVRASFSPDGERILTSPVLLRVNAPAIPAHTARLWQWNGHAVSRVAEMPHEKQIYFATFSPDGKRVLTASWDETARLWNGRDGSETAVLSHRNWVDHGAFSSDGTRVLTCSKDYTARLWSTDGELLHELRGHDAAVTCAAFSPDSAVGWMVTGSYDNTARVWDGAGRQIAVLRGDRSGEGIRRAAFVPASDPPRVVTGSFDGAIRVWNVWDPELPVLLGHEGGVLWADFSPDGKLVATASHDGTIRLWDRAGHCLRVFRGHGGAVACVRFSPDGDKLVSASSDATAVIWDVATGAKRETIHETGYVMSACFHPERDLILTYANDGAPKLWTLEAQPVETEFERGVRGRAVFSPDGTRVLVSQRGGTARLYTLDGRAIDDYGGHSGYGILSTVAFDPSGTHVLTAGWDGKAILWPLEGRDYVLFEGPELRVNSAQFSPDGERIVTAHADGLARVWARDGTLLTALPGHRSAVQFAMFTPEGDRILTCSMDGTARFWFANESDLLTYARQRSSREFTAEEQRRYAHLLDVEKKATSAESPAAGTLLARPFRRLAWDLVDPSHPPEEWQPERALRAAQRAVELSGSTDTGILTALGVALYRAGRCEEALGTLGQADELNRSRGTPRSAVDLAFLALTQHRLGHVEEAEAALAEAKELLGPTPGENASVSEAEAILEDRR